MKKKQIILDVAAGLFSRKGFNETPISEISRLTGAAEGTIFYHYKTKEGLFLAILEDFKNSIVEEFQRYIEEKKFDSGIKMMEDIISFYLNLSGSMEDRFLLLHRHDAYELSAGNAQSREYLEAIYNCLIDIFEKAILLGQEDGSIEKEVHPRKTAMIIFGMVDALVRFNTYNLYNAGALYDELIKSSRRILKA
ncbi:MAG: TetR/AcrR family transcriptional regulator [Deltaproteobacteria bacterium]|nr:TetR/AcrR family transcriptional regulator [Deltaproteobacteria bacterium]